MSENRFAFLGEIISKRPLLIACLAAVTAMLFAAGYLKEREAEILRVAEPVSAVIATRDIQAGELLDEGAITGKTIPLKFSEPGALGDIENASGRVAAVPIRKNAQVTAMNARLASEIKSVSPLIPAGKRAVSVALDDAGAMAGLLKPNDMVDVIATFDLGGESQVKRTTLAVAENVQVLAVGKDVADSVQRQAGKTGKSGIFGGGAPVLGPSGTQTVVTIAADPAEAQKILFAGQSGAVSLVLRPFGDDGTIEGTEPTTISTITGGHDGLIPFKKGYREYKGR